VSPSKQAETEKNLGTEQYKKRNFDQALVHYKKAFELDPTNITAFTNLAAVHMETKEFDKAIDLCRDGIKVGQEHKADFKLVAKAFVRIGNAYMKQDKLEEAIDAYQKAQVEDYTDDTKKLIKKAEEVKKKRDAEAYIDPAKSMEHKETGNKLFQENKFIEAIAEYTEALKRDPSNYKVLSNRAACYSKLMDWNRALDDCDACLQKDPNFVKVYIRKAKVQHFLKQYHKALETYDAGLKLDPASSELIDGRRQTLVAISAENMSGSVDPQRAKEALKDPEIQQILRDPAVNAALQRMQEDPKSAAHVLQDKVMGAKIEKLIHAGVLQVR
jgi:stress-induced-phosphoprotein 1